MSYPPDPNNPYAASPYGQPQAGYGYPQQPAGYGYPQYPGGGPGMPQRMPGQTVTARVLLFVAGSLWVIMAVFMLIGGIIAQHAMHELDVAGTAETGIFILMAFIALGVAALHIVPASMFGKGAGGTRVTAIIAAALNAVVALLGTLSSAAQGNGGGMVLSVLWTATAIVTLVFCSMSVTGQWFQRQRY